MNIPKIVFKKLSLEETIDNIIWTYFDDGFHDDTVSMFPELGNIDKKLSKKEIEDKISELFTRYYKCNQNNIDNDIKKYNDLWNKYNDKYMEALSEYLNIDWGNIKTIYAYVGIVCICPRYLDDNSFVIGANFNDESVIRICAHECLHFIWFRKWKELYKDSKREEFETPHIVWKYSEMVTDSIINSKKIKNIIHVNEKSYSYFYDYDNNGENVMSKLKDIFNEDVNIEERIKKGFDYVKDYFKGE